MGIGFEVVCTIICAIGTNRKDNYSTKEWDRYHNVLKGRKYEKIEQEK